MTMVSVRIVRVRVHHPLVPVRVRMRLRAVPRLIVRVLVMRIVNMAMAVFHRLVNVHMVMVLGVV